MKHTILVILEVIPTLWNNFYYFVLFTAAQFLSFSRVRTSNNMLTAYSLRKYETLSYYFFNIVRNGRKATVL